MKTPRTLLFAIAFVLPFAAPLCAQAPTPHYVWAKREPVAGESVWLRATWELPGDAVVDYADLFIAADASATLSLGGATVASASGYERLAHYQVRTKVTPGKNVLAVAAKNDTGPAAILVSLHIVLKDGGERWIVSDGGWKASDKAADKWDALDFDDSAWKPAISLGPVGTAPWGTPTTEVEHYHQWKQALGVTTAVDPRTIQVPHGYEIELLRSAGKDEGSWISLAFDQHGQLYIGREDKGVLRLALPKLPPGKLAGEAVAKALRVETINDTLLEPRGLLFVKDDLYVQANNSRGLYRLRDSTPGGLYDEVTLLRELPGDVGHGRNDLTLGPDGRLYLIYGNDVRYPVADQPGSSPLRHFAQDRLLPCVWNKNLFNAGTPAPGGYVIRTDLEAKTWDVVAAGFRNAYGIAFNRDGEMFSYDSDMEWDAGAPWYRPTRINHIVSGGDYGWRQGVDKWRAWYPDSLPTTLDIGLGSPTAVKFGYDSGFAPQDREKLFALDWAFGRIIAVDLQPRGASYAATQATFISGRPLNVCDLEFGPDGAMYFVTGGRRTQSGIYRVVFTGNAEARAIDPPTNLAREKAASARTLRRQLEAYHGGHTPENGIDVWPHLASDDPWLRHAARVALESQPLAGWQAKALQETNPAIACQALLALARVGSRDVQPDLLAALLAAPWDKLRPSDRLAVLRAMQLSLVRQGRAEDASLRALRESLGKRYPAATVEENDLLCELLVYLESPRVVEQTLLLLDAAVTPEEKLHYLHSLRLVKTPWTLPQRQAYFAWLQRAEAFPGAHYMPRFVAFIRQDAVAALTDAERTALGKLLEPAASAAPTSPNTVVRPFVKAWTWEDFAADWDRPRKPVDAAAGAKLFAAAQCASCHRVRGEGALVGPDLTGVGKRFSKRDVLLSILEPSRVIDDKYKQKTIVTTAGIALTGQEVAVDDEAISLVTDATQPTRITRIPRGEIAESRTSALSPMPVGQINVLTRDEVLALLDYLTGT